MFLLLGLGDIKNLDVKNTFSRDLEHSSENSGNLAPHGPGQETMMHNQHGTGNITKKWDRSVTLFANLGPGF